MQTVYRTVNPNFKLFSFPTLFPNPSVSRNTYFLDFAWVKILYFPFSSTGCGWSHSPGYCLHSGYQQKMPFVSAWVALVPWGLQLMHNHKQHRPAAAAPCMAPHISICTWILLMNKNVSGQDAQKRHPLQTCNYIWNKRKLNSHKQIWGLNCWHVHTGIFLFKNHLSTIHSMLRKTVYQEIQPLWPMAAEHLLHRSITYAHSGWIKWGVMPKCPWLWHHGVTLSHCSPPLTGLCRAEDTAVPGGCDKGRDSWKPGTGFRAGATVVCRAALCALLFTSSCIQFAESWFNIFTQRERE